MIVMSNPMDLFAKNIKLAMKAEKQANAFVLSTIIDNRPTSRVVLLKRFDKKKFIFFTNLTSNKAQAIINNSRVNMCFYWPNLDRQIRVEGVAKITAKNNSDYYFNSRNRQSQIGAWSSKQSQIMEHEDDLDKIFIDNKNKFANQAIPRPDFWGGIEINPVSMEFWYSGKFRLHSRVLYSKSIDSKIWIRQYLYP